MEYETLALEVSAKTAGLDVLKPPIAMGRTGVEHKFSFLATSGQSKYAFDFYDAIDEIEVLRTYIKKFDTGVKASLVCTGKNPTDKAVALSREYGMTILSKESLPSFFRGLTVERGASALVA